MGEKFHSSVYQLFKTELCLVYVIFQSLLLALLYSCFLLLFFLSYRHYITFQRNFGSNVSTKNLNTNRRLNDSFIFDTRTGERKQNSNEFQIHKTCLCRLSPNHEPFNKSQNHFPLKHLLANLNIFQPFTNFYFFAPNLISVAEKARVENLCSFK